MVHFDAHCDTWTDHFSEPSGHGTWLYEAIEQGLVSATHTVQVGIRSSGAREAREFVQDQGGVIYTARALRGKDGEDLQSTIDAIRERLGNRPCYLTLDIDCLDPAFAPGTGTPEPGGLTSSQVMTLLEGLAPLNWVAMGTVWRCPRRMTMPSSPPMPLPRWCGHIWPGKLPNTCQPCRNRRCHWRHLSACQLVDTCPDGSTCTKFCQVTEILTIGQMREMPTVTKQRHHGGASG